MALGLQNKSMEDISETMKIEHNQILALYNKTIKRLTASIKKSFEQKVEQKLGFVNKNVETVPLNMATEEIIGNLERKKKISKN